MSRSHNSSFSSFREGEIERFTSKKFKDVPCNAILPFSKDVFFYRDTYLVKLVFLLPGMKQSIKAEMLAEL